jgi:hypothetical protein
VRKNNTGLLALLIVVALTAFVFTVNVTITNYIKKRQTLHVITQTGGLSDEPDND